MTQPVTNPAMTEDWLPDPPAISAVIHRDPCEHCGENAFGWASLDERADECHGQVVSRIAEYHRDDCSLSANGSYIVATVPVSQVQVAGEMLGDPDSR